MASFLMSSLDRLLLQRDGDDPRCSCSADSPHRYPVVHDLVSVDLKFTKDRISNVCRLINLAGLLDPLAGLIKSPDEFLTTTR
jgi:hypothetical protein